MDMSKEEILGSIQQLSARRKQAAAEVTDADSARQSRKENLPSYESLSQAMSDRSAAVERLKSEAASDEEYTRLNRQLEEAKEKLAEVESSLSNMLVLYTVKTNSKTVHAEADEDASFDREIKIEARLGKKVPAQTSLFGGADND